jgi:hypothetical protein
MTCKLDENCPFSDQTPTCERVEHCCLDKLAVKDAEIAKLKSENASYLHHMHDIQREFMETINRLRREIGELKK